MPAAKRMKRMKRKGQEVVYPLPLLAVNVRLPAYRLLPAYLFQV